MVLFGSTTSPFAKVAVSELPVGILPLFAVRLRGALPDPFHRRPGRPLAAAPRRLAPAGAGRGLLRADQSGLLPQRGPAGAELARRASSMRSARWSSGSWRGCWATRSSTSRRLWGVLASIAGVVVIGLGNLWGGHGGSPAETRNVMLADLLLVGAVLSWGAYLTLSKPLILRHGALPVLAGTFLMGCLLSSRSPWSPSRAGCRCSARLRPGPGSAWRSSPS